MDDSKLISRCAFGGAAIMFILNFLIGSSHGAPGGFIGGAIGGGVGAAVGTVIVNVRKSSKSSDAQSSDRAAPTDAPPSPAPSQGIMRDLSSVAGWVLARGDKVTTTSIDIIRRAKEAGYTIEYYTNTRVIFSKGKKQIFCDTNKEIEKFASSL